MNKSLIFVVPLLLLGSYDSKQSIAQMSEGHGPATDSISCTQAPQLCEGGILQYLRADKPTAFLVTSRNNSSSSLDVRVPPRNVDILVGTGDYKFYWPDDEDFTGRVARANFLKRLRRSSRN